MSITTFLIGVSLGMAGLIVANVAAAMIVDAMRTRHPQVWSTLGEPSWFFIQMQVSPARAEMWRYVFCGDFKELGDPALSRLCNICRGSVILSVAIVATMIVIGAASS